MTSLDDLKKELISNVKFQQTPIQMTDSDYMSFTVQGVKRLYVDEGIEDEFLSDFDKIQNTLVRDLTLTEQEYAYTSAEIAFKNQIKADLQAIVGYSTNALSISNADKPYTNLNNDIKDLENRLSQLAWKFSHRQG
jgi:hypothetical protein